MATSTSHRASRIQEQFWLIEQLHPGNRAYAIPSVFHVQGQLNVVALRDALRDLVARHGVLRSGFIQHGGELFQEVHESAEFELPLEHASPETLDALVLEEIQKPFDLSLPPLIRGRLWRLPENRHCLCLTMHHIITDLASKQILGRELAELYDLHHAGRSGSELEIADGQYHEFAAREREWLQSPAKEAAVAHFQRAIGGECPALALPTDHRRPALQDHAGARVEFAFTTSETEAIGARARELQSAPFLVLLTAYAILLARLSNEQQLNIGVPFTNRRNAGDKSTIGCFMNILPLRVDLGQQPSFKQLLRQIRGSMLLHHRNQELPLTEIISALNPPRDGSRNALFQGGFTFENPMELHLGQAHVESTKVHAGGSQLDVFMVLWNANGQLHGHLEFATSLFERNTVERWVSNYKQLVLSVLEQGISDMEVGRLPLLGPEELDWVLRRWNATSKAQPEPVLLHKMFEQQVSTTPERVALASADKQLTYAELDARANALAHQLIAIGLQPGAPVGLFFERSMEMVIGIYGVLKAGGAYLPLDPEYPANRLRAVLEDAKPSAILHGPDAKLEAIAGTHPLIALDACTEPNSDTHRPAVDMAPDLPAYVIFTSGSTGRPKGVQVSHRATHSHIHWMQATFALQASDVVVQKTPFTFDVSVWEFFWPLTAGARLEILPPGMHADPGAMIEFFNSRNVSTAHFVPSMLGVFLEHPKASSCTTLTRVLSSGEALHTDTVRRFNDTLSAQLHNLYGPTEAAVDVTWWPCQNNPQRDPVPIGAPVANTQIYLLDEYLQPTPRAVAGELCIGGTQVALGYINRPELTNERFVLDPWAKDPAARLYRTGDLARWSDDGNLEFLGRIDQQVKLRGQRIELEEIEVVLMNHAAVAQAVVVVQRHPSGEESLVACVRLDPGVEGGSATDLRDHVSRYLPDYMIPRQITMLDVFPLTSSGKVDRKQLPPKDSCPSHAEHEDSPPGAVEEQLLAIWRRLLSVPEVGTRDNFFDLGGNSLLCARILAELRTSHGDDLPLVALFEHPTVESLARYLESRKSSSPHSVDMPDEAMRRARERGARLRRRRPR